VDKAIPSYPPFAKRILLDNGWYDAISLPNVELVVEDIERITATAIVTKDEVERPADIIVLATGFRINPLAAKLNIFGREGRDLREAFHDDDPQAYLGITVAGFPNFFMMAGPNTGLAHGGSAVFQAESQARYISGMIVQMTENGITSCDVTQSAQDEFVRLVDTEHQKLIWTHPGVSNYYKNKSGRIFSAMPFRLVDYWQMTRWPSLEPYETTRAN
jgi:4-hydroxyacetophenone monooxygenase